MGMLTKKMALHPTAAIRIPPTKGPTAMEIACTAPWMPMALPRSWAGNACVIRATELACRSPAPTAWTTRDAIMKPAVLAAPHRTEPMEKMTKPML